MTGGPVGGLQHGQLGGAPGVVVGESQRLRHVPVPCRGHRSAPRPERAGMPAPPRPGVRVEPRGSAFMFAQGARPWVAIAESDPVDCRAVSNPVPRPVRHERNAALRRQRPVLSKTRIAATGPIPTAADPSGVRSSPRSRAIGRNRRPVPPFRPRPDRLRTTAGGPSTASSAPTATAASASRTSTPSTCTRSTAGRARRTSTRRRTGSPGRISTGRSPPIPSSGPRSSPCASSWTSCTPPTAPTSAPSSPTSRAPGRSGGCRSASNAPAAGPRSPRRRSARSSGGSSRRAGSRSSSTPATRGRSGSRSKGASPSSPSSTSSSSGRGPGRPARL